MTTTRTSEYRLRRRVQFYEADPAGIVHFSWFFRYMEEAEHALRRAAGLSIAPPGAEIVFPRVAASFDYQNPLRFDEEFDVHIRIAAISTRSIRYVCEMTREGTPIAAGTMTVACVRRIQGQPMKSTEIPPAIGSRFAAASSNEGSTS